MEGDVSRAQTAMTAPNLPIKRIILVTSGIELGSVSWLDRGKLDRDGFFMFSSRNTISLTRRRSAARKKVNVPSRCTATTEFPRCLSSSGIRPAKAVGLFAGSASRISSGWMLYLAAHLGRGLVLAQ